MTQLVNLSNATEFNTLIGNQLSLIAFLATWSEPCRRQNNILSEFSNEHRNDLSIATVNVDELSPIATMCKIQTLPTLLIYFDGKELYRLVGLQKIKALNQVWKNIKDSSDSN